MTTLFAEIARALYGDTRVATQLAAHFGVGRRIVQRWMAGDIEPPMGVWEDLLLAVKERRECLQELANRLAIKIEVAPRGEHFPHRPGFPPYVPRR